MGGRSSTFKVDKNKDRIDSRNIDYEPLIPTNDTISERNNDNIDILQEDNITICRSTDNFSHENINPNLLKIREINNKYYGITKNIKHSNLDVRGAKFKGNTVACFSYNPYNKENMTIFLNSNLSTRTKQQIEEQAKKQIDMKHWSPCDKENLINQTLAHEYGHFVHKLILDKQKDKEEISKMSTEQIYSYEKMLAWKCKKDILKIQKEKFNSNNEFISNYAKDNSFEFFAETFANLVNSKNPTTLAKSLEIYIKENL